VVGASLFHSVHFSVFVLLAAGVPFFCFFCVLFFVSCTCIVDLVVLLLRFAFPCTVFFHPSVFCVLCLVVSVWWWWFPICFGFGGGGGDGSGFVLVVVVTDLYVLFSGGVF
jgi:hypothetical protein